MDIVAEQKEGCALLKVKGRMDAVTAPEFETACAGVADQGQKVVLADLSELEYISSAGLRSILASAKKLKAQGGDLKFCCLSGMVSEVFSISGFEKMFTIVGTVEEGLEACK